MGSYQVTFEINEDTTALLYLSVLYSMDFPLLLFLYEKYGKDTFYFFYALRKKRIELPPSRKMTSILNHASDFLRWSKKHTAEKDRLEFLETLKGRERAFVERFFGMQAEGQFVFDIDVQEELIPSEKEIAMAMAAQGNAAS